jgi:hypothetical protein
MRLTHAADAGHGDLELLGHFCWMERGLRGEMRVWKGNGSCGCRQGYIASVFCSEQLECPSAGDSKKKEEVDRVNSIE